MKSYITLAIIGFSSTIAFGQMEWPNASQPLKLLSLSEKTLKPDEINLPFNTESRTIEYLVSKNTVFPTSGNNGQSKLTFVGTGDIQKSLSQGDEIAANTGLGAIFNRIFDEKAFFSDLSVAFSINVASSVDTIKAKYIDGEITNSRDFGAYLLVPQNSGQAVQLNFNVYLKPEKIKIFEKKPIFLSNLFSGFNTEFIASNRVWQNNSVSQYASTFLFRTHLFHDFIPNEIRLEKGYAIRIGIGYTYRGLGSDVGFKNETTNEFRNEILGATETHWDGFEYGLSIEFKNITASAYIPVIKSNPDIPGLTGFQFVTSIKFSGGFPVELSSESLANDGYTPDN